MKSAPSTAVSGPAIGGPCDAKITTVLLVTLALELACQESSEHTARADIGVTLADLVGSKGFVELTDRLNGVPVPLIADVCKGQSFTWPPADEYWHAAMSDVEAEPGVQERRAARTAALVKDAQAQMAAALTLDVKERSGLTEQRLAKRLGVTDTRLAHVSLQLWHGTFRKNAIAAPGLTPPSRRRVVSRASCARNSRKHSPMATVEKYQTQSGATLYMVRALSHTRAWPDQEARVQDEARR